MAWKDLVGLSPLEILKELTLPLPWLLAAIVLANGVVPGVGPWASALPSFVFFLVGLRLVHDVFHRNLSLPRLANDVVLTAMSVLMLGSMHAVEWNHLRHHRLCLTDDDVEARSARMGGLGALLWGPVFPVTLHATALKKASSRYRWWIGGDLMANCLWIAFVVGTPYGDVFRWHVLWMGIGQCLTAFFAVWTVHHGCDRSGIIARTLRNPFKSAIAFDMFFHLEHHLFPKVPTCRLPTLARRLDSAAPDLDLKQVY